jgi:GNAT superfamily N-acetyltransferase
VIDWNSSVLTSEHDLSEFDCGVPALNDWLRTHAIDAGRRGTARTNVWTPMGNDRVVAYYSLAPYMVARDGLTSTLAGGLNTSVPGYLLGKLALDKTLHGRGNGAELLFDALSRVAEVADLASGRLLVVDAIDERAAAFYRKYRFRPATNDPLRLVIKIATIQQAFGS